MLNNNTPPHLPDIPKREYPTDAEAVSYELGRKAAPVITQVHQTLLRYLESEEFRRNAPKDIPDMTEEERAKRFSKVVELVAQFQGCIYAVANGDLWQKEGDHVVPGELAYVPPDHSPTSVVLLDKDNAITVTWYKRTNQYEDVSEVLDLWIPKEYMGRRADLTIGSKEFDDHSFDIRDGQLVGSSSNITGHFGTFAIQNGFDEEE